MKKLLQITLLLLLTFVFTNTLFGQICGVDDYYQEQAKSNTKYKLQKKENEQEYLQYLEKLNALKNLTTQNILLPRTEDNAWGLCDASTRVLKIPVVVHIIHTGEVVGVGYNRSDAWVNTLITNLNQKFRNLDNNAKSVDTKIEFYLAKRDSSGNATTGINRVNGTLADPNYANIGYSNSNGNALRDLGRWATDKYLNIWIVNKFESGIGGFGNYPDDDPYNGTVITGNYYKLAVHELGHVFSLLHTFEGDNNGTTCPADNNCLTDGDYVCDTPPHSREDCNVTACPAVSSNGIWNNSLYNFMSYYYAAAGNCNKASELFTQGQKDRIRAAALGKYRGKLLISEALIPTNNVVEAGIKQIKTSCFTNFSPEVTLKNYGTTAINTLTFECRIDGILVQTYNYTGNISSNTVGTIVLDVINVTASIHSIEIKWTAINGVNTDDFQDDNTYCGSFTSEVYTTNSSVENFETNILPSYWKISQGSRTPINVFANGNCANNGSYLLRFNGFNSSMYGTDSEKTTIVELDKTLDLTNATQAQFTFNIAARRTYYNNYWKSLKLEISTDCGNTWTNVYHKNDMYNNSPGSETPTTNPLWTVTVQNAPSIGYLPSACNDWRQETINLAAYLNQRIKFRFIYYGYNGNPDNVYLDNITVSKTVPVCVKSPNQSTPDAYNNITNIPPIGITTYAIKQQNWTENVPNAFLVLESKNKGFVITRISTAQRDAITPVQGMLIYNTDTSANCFQVYNGVVWKCIEKSCNE
jgi:hypothetical protein